MIKKIVFSVAVVCLLLAGTTMAGEEEMWWGFVGTSTGTWESASNWYEGYLPDSDPGVWYDDIVIDNTIGGSSVNATCTLNSTVPDVGYLRLANYYHAGSTTFEIQSNGSLVGHEPLYLGYGDGDTTSMIVDGGSYTSVGGGADLRVGWHYNTDSLLAVTGGGSITGNQLVIGYANTSTVDGKVELLDGTIELSMDSTAVVQFQTGANSASLEFGADGTLILAADRTQEVNGYWDEEIIPVWHDGWTQMGRMYTDVVGQSVLAVYNEGEDKTYVSVVPEPATIVLLSIGGLLLRRRRK